MYNHLKKPTFSIYDMTLCHSNFRYV